MIDSERSAAGSALTNLVLDLFRLNNRMLTSGDRLVAGLGLTSARWQVLGTVGASERPQPVAWIARDMGANRQNVQRIVNDLEKEGLVAFAANPHHRRAQLVVLTEKGRETFAAAMRLQAPWASGLANGLEMREIETAHRVMKALLHKLEGSEEAGEQA
ncbi:MarR family winged helix-turn-helix transcriptional regulator [Rhizobium aethiopicum]|uniref:MarR family winged helix-turn-helix transcriptional regulator n=1 Tax=Rhizobium aethiopicum TaxID=1138170 RepID=UPI00160FF01D|nr:MarR family winged helix-turn-helix transcriptional regulator [Rhizobium aethiopicum]